MPGLRRSPYYPSTSMDGGVFIIDALSAPLPQRSRRVHPWAQQLQPHLEPNQNRSPSMDGEVMVVDALQTLTPRRRIHRFPPNRRPLRRPIVELPTLLYVPEHSTRVATSLLDYRLDVGASPTTSSAATAVERLRNAKRIDGEGLPADCGDCPICLEKLSCGRTVIETRCSHLFHERCVCRWLEGHDTCPSCRGRV